ncbi:hypothetical protein [Terriglobus saanensis]|uniref:Uncharacterized protein n=1 Tax=Terriglobus saanensis (strain ATCC BAA-1853 / DSM 23119 / SP1PR4) TaxID=401053 RepID=E8V039_TERSS|nr:hypothetical protein [Terriglobus saanensis]ADV82194.1 hypothetical protein AciPR4_1370 [Terriglobus saanensis SP1PR4]
MKRMGMALLLVGLSGVSTIGYGETLSGLCMVSSAHNVVRDLDTADLLLHRTGCDNEEYHCGNSENSNIAWSRWSGVSPEALRQEGAVLTAEMKGEAGALRCSGTVHEGILAGKYEFTPNAEFVQKMAAMGFDEITTRKQEGFLTLDVTTGWVRQVKDAGVTELSTNKLMGLRALHVDPEYIRAMAAAGYPELRANKLTEMKAVGVTPEKAAEAKSLGFNPSEQELIQMSIFKIDRPFVERMRSKGLNDLTLAKLIKVKIFKLEE